MFLCPTCYCIVYYFSGYKLSLHKSELFPINEAALALTYTNLPFQMVTHQFNYLGITMTRKHSDLFKENFLTLLSLLLWISLIGQINSVNMNILPKFLYLFQSITNFIPKSFFDSLDSAIYSFVWKGKCPLIFVSITGQEIYVVLFYGPTFIITETVQPGCPWS